MRKNQPRRKRRQNEVRENPEKCACRKQTHKGVKRGRSSPIRQLTGALRLTPGFSNVKVTDDRTWLVLVE